MSDVRQVVVGVFPGAICLSKFGGKGSFMGYLRAKIERDFI